MGMAWLQAAVRASAPLAPRGDAPLRGGLILADDIAPVRDYAIHLVHEQWTVSPLLWGYLAVALVVIAVLWWLLRHWRPVWRALARAGGAALLLSPAILACGSIAIMPFPVLLLRAAQSTDAVSCGAPLVALPPNAMTFAGLWLVLFLALWAWGWFRQPAGNGRR